MLTLINDPAGISGRQRHAWDTRATLQANIERRLASGFGCHVFINGEHIDPCADPRMQKPPSDGDEVFVIRRPEGLDPFTWYLIAAAFAVVLAVALMPSVPNSTGSGKDSPNNKLTSQTNVARAYQAIPDVYGYRRCWPDLIQPSTVEYVDNVKFVTEWLCVSRGVGTITDVRYAETPIGDIAGASYEVFQPGSAGYPEFGSTSIADVLETFASDEVNGQEVPYAMPFATLTKTGTFTAAAGATTFTAAIPDGTDLVDLKSLVPSGTAQVTFTLSGAPFDAACTVLGVAVAGGTATFTFSSPAWPSAATQPGTPFTIKPNGITTTVLGPYTLPVACDRLRWNTVFLRGLKGSVPIKAEWWQIDSGGNEIAGTRQTRTDTYTADTFDQRFYTVNATPTAGYGRYRVQFTRTNAQVNGQGADVAKLEEVYAVRYYANKVLPGVTVIRVTTKATTDATGYSERKFNLRWQRLVRTLTTDTLSESRNFGRAMAHLWTVAGNDIAGLDTDALAVINAALGEDSPLLRFDGSLDDADMSLGERMQLMAGTARCFVWRDGTRWTVTRDQAKPYPEMQLDYRNLAAGGDSTISYAAFLPASNDGVEVEYVNETDQSKKDYIRLSNASGTPSAGVARNPKKIQLPACTTQAQAMNRAQMEARRLLYQRTSVQDMALSDAGALGLGACIRWIDPNDFAGDDGLQAGEVLAIDTAANSIRTSEPIDWKGKTQGRIVFTGADGYLIGGIVTCYPAGDGVALASIPAGLYVAGADRQLGSRYAFGVGVTDAEMEAAGLYTITEIRPSADRTLSLAFASYDARIFEAD